MKTRKLQRTASLVAACVCALWALPSNSHDATPGAVQLGKVAFKVDCNAQAQQAFNLAMGYYHSFAWGQWIEEPLARTLAADPGCGMAHWARALALLDNPFAWPGNLSPQTLANGMAALDAARVAGLRSQRERDYVDALTVFFRDADKLNHRTRAKALETEMEKVAQRYPDDAEAAILHALVLSANFDPADKQYTNQLRAARLLEPIFKALPEHPGAAHYLIHSYDYPPIAHLGLDAARRYSKIAPSAPHAQHMPAHIFTRVGAWKDSVESNRASAAADAVQGWNAMHAFDYMAYAHLQLGQDTAVRQLVSDALKVDKETDRLAVAYALAAIPARLTLERDDWKGAAVLTLKPAMETYPWKKYPQAEAVHVFARGVGAARSQDVALAQAQVQRLQVLRDEAVTMKIAYWADQIDIQAEAVRGLSVVAEGKLAEGLDILAKAAAREDATEKHVVTPGPILPAREILASTLLDQGRAADALREFEAVLVKEPNRLRATLGAAQAAERSGNTTQARIHYAKVVELTQQADMPLRPEMMHARQMASRN
ncbi:tetratricopeptide repeat protein [Hydrogenophaga sp. OTU3427]|uniref:tetratricopeptide repeat protein n=1 Tax=Hydrogenophaga sp. OTU3427 TaxID=3043856 RepID=UPI00313D9685